MIKACIFDLDGTLADTLDSIVTVANDVLGMFSLGPLPREDYKYYVGDGATMLVRRCLKAAGDTDLTHLEEMDRIYRERFNADPLYKVAAYEGMQETLMRMKEEGILLGVCTNKPQPAADKVIHTLFGDLFDAVVGQRAGLARKPAPDSALLIAEQFGVKPEECMYAGDTATDMQTGLGAGMFTVGVLWGFRPREELVRHHAQELAEKPSDLQRILHKQGLSCETADPKKRSSEGE